MSVRPGEEQAARTGYGLIPVTRRLAETASKLSFDYLPIEVVEAARHCFLDWLGVTLAGSSEPVTRILLAMAAEQGGNPQATVMGTAQRYPVQRVALVNGTASHALDFDDVNAVMGGHPSVPVFPALLALAEQRESSGPKFLCAFVAGYETECRVAAAIMPGHYEAGWHTTATAGTFGAAAACTRIVGLDEDRCAHALGIAGTSAAGLKSMFGTMCKPLHAGRAAANGLAAAQLAALGMTSHPDVLEAEQGFAATQAPEPSLESALEGLGERFHVRDTLFKYHAACFLTHSSIEALHKLRAENDDLRIEDVRSVRLAVPPGHLSVCNIRRPKTPLEGKFSLPFTAALALAGSGTGEAAFTDKTIRDPDLVAIQDKVAVEPSSEFPNNHTSRVEVELHGGEMLSDSVNMQAPEEDLELQWRRLSKKFMSLAQPALGEEKAEDLLGAVAKLETVEDMSEITALCTTDGEGEAR